MKLFYMKYFVLYCFYEKLSAGVDFLRADRANDLSSKGV